MCETQLKVPEIQRPTHRIKGADLTENAFVSNQESSLREEQNDRLPVPLA